MNNTKVLKVYNPKLITGRWSKFSYYIKNKISKIRYKLLSLFIDLENSKEYEHGNLGIHNHRMIVDNWYKFAYYFKCVMYRLRYKFLSFLVDVILTILMLIFFILLCIVVGLITFVAMTILINPKSFSSYG
jgi:hypothetical protein